MKGRNSSRTFESGNPLPPNVYRSNKWNAGDRGYRYKYPDGKFKRIPATEEAEVRRLAEEVNQAVENLQGEIEKNKKENRAYDDLSVGRWLEQFRAEYLEAKADRCSEDYLSARVGALSKHLEPLLHEAVNKMTRQRLNACWREMSHHSQKNMRATLRRFIQYLLDFDVVPLLDGRNPFWDESAGGLQFKDAPIEKERGTMTAEIFEKIKKVAFDLGYHFLIDAMDVSFLTYFRLNDVITLRFDEHIKDGCLSRVISKSEGRRKSKPILHSYDLAMHRELKEVISRSRLRADVGWQCPFIIHHSFTRYAGSKKKEHKNQVTRFYINECINECMDYIEETKHTPQRRRPSFHEIRALRLSIDKASRKFEDISQDMAHTDTKITSQSYDTHSKHSEHVVNYVPSLKSLRGG